MNISIKNLGIVQNAEIELNGLTILTGYNDTGKSFMGKVIFSIIKTIKEAHTHYAETRLTQSLNGLNVVEQSHRTVVPFNTERTQKFINITTTLRNRLFDYIFYPQKDNDIFFFIEGYHKSILTDIEASPNQIKVSVETVEINKKRIEDSFNTIIGILHDDSDDQSIYKTYFDTIIIQELFGGQINTTSDDSLLEITLIQGSTILLKIVVANNSVKEFNYKNKIFQTDATIIETPIIIQLDKYYFRYNIRSRNGIIRRDFLPYHYGDLLTKFTDVDEGSPSPMVSHPEILSQITGIIGGEIVYTGNEKSLYFIKNNNTKIPSSNIATGIKSFGLLQLLLRSANINENSFLIIDEPEVHLHPKWEIDYAKIIVLLSKAGIPIVISTHSPYFLQALVKFVSDMETQSITKFYFGEKNNNLENGLSTFRDVTDNLEPIFRALAKPMQEIYSN